MLINNLELKKLKVNSSTQAMSAHKINVYKTLLNRGNDFRDVNKRF